MTSQPTNFSDNTGVVAIGRNEGERLRRCLASLVGQARHIVYVDSGSTDDSLVIAKSFHVEVVELDKSRPFSAARARNAGAARLQQLVPSLEFIQFVDGDCEVMPAWIATAEAVLTAHPEVAIVCGRRSERYLEKSVYNVMCHLEWDTPVGEAKACGGDALVRLSAFNAVQGYREEVIAAEDDEFCLRVRRTGAKIFRIDASMTLHDAAMTRFSQWWKRMNRSGFAYANGAHLHGNSPDRHFIRDCRRIWLWGLIVPLVALALVWPTYGWSLTLLLLYPLMLFKIFRYARSRNWPKSHAFIFAFFTLIAKFPCLVGIFQFHIRRLFKHEVRIIEYKGAETT